MSAAPISVVICTRDRADSLSAALDAWTALLDDRSWALVVVDDGSTDDTARRLDRTALGDRLRVVTTSGVGLGAARNAGWLAASGELVLFTDDDCYPDPSLPGALRAVFADRRIDFAGGRLLPYSPEEAGIAVVTRTERVELTGPSFVPAGLLPGANLTVRRSALEGVGGFDPAFGAGTSFPAEDVELVARLLASGSSGVYEPALIVRHHHRRTTAESRRRLERQYDRGRGAYYAKCLGNPALRGIYAREWVRRTVKGSWPRAGRELRGALAWWTRKPAGR